MIHITFKKNKSKQWVSYEINGHAAFSESGTDIVCAAVSTLAIVTCNNLEQIAQYQPIVDVEEEFGGYLYVEILSDLSDEQQAISQILLENLYLGLIMVRNEYSDFVEIEIFE
ncbi:MULTISPECIES: ribosomal-processing cysteine protease Prp [unclassified Granulicatella]|uniref:ribosomal-processing cysteine protease Prp n=1 Tax=unclassified Granulicatella TaxID=2630493 RepID=UPI0010733D2A|nr:MULTISPECIES: ribosomal-processing cysteine protease Prp [unclassified Granulicatella]MBF0780189.1 ribosomal-processing cysteine protease Prp [Granulicatella sp. 19428wC4_WM01]TFU95683.1 ribosomal-processing cysteine protease Prp [Granulicatella sp. WM01]